MGIGVLHVLQQLSRAGASRALVATAASASRDGASSHRIVSLCQVEAGALRIAADAGLAVLVAPTAAVLDRELRTADILHVHYWHTPELVAFMRGAVAPSRVLLWSDVPGDTPPHLLPRALMDWADVTVASGPYTLTLPVFTDLDEETRRARTAMIFDTPDFSRLHGVTPRRHETFNVGYIGTVDFVKMHPDYVAMSAAIAIPDVRFIVCGSGNGFAQLQQQAARCGARDRFELRGYVEDVRSLFEVLDVFGYPIVHSSAELVLQEAMFAGVPPVILARSGAQCVVRDGDTGLVVNGPEEYSRAVEWLYHRPDERRRLSVNAADYARRVFGAGRAADALNVVYARMMTRPKKARRWPFPLRARATSRSAWTFLDLLDEVTARPFKVSLTDTAWAPLLDAEAAIAAAPPVMVDAAAGGVLHYRRRFPDDPHLRLWSGLALRAQGRPALAIGEFEAARRLGLDHWRVSWYVAETARANGLGALAAEALIRVVEAAPDFMPAREALEAMDGVRRE